MNSEACHGCVFTEECRSRGIVPPASGTSCGWKVVRTDQEGTVEATQDTSVGYLDAHIAMYQHLHFNHFPPVDEMFVEPCLAAIDAANNGEPEQEIELPNGITYRDYGESCPASALIETFHLDTFIETDGD